LVLIFVIGTINAYNFMDGINGITGSYSLLAILSLLYINKEVVVFTNDQLLISLAISLLIFNWFNFRKKAKCFAGDVGSISIAFALVFLIAQLILKTSNITYVLILLVYGLDTSLTVIFRKIRGENIFAAHRSHFYQYLANEKAWSHVAVSTLYFFVQLGVNFAVIFCLHQYPLLALAFTIGFTVVFLLLRFSVEGKKRLIGKYQLKNIG